MLVCKSCGAIQTPYEAKLSETIMSSGGRHIRADCGHCGRWIKWLGRRTEYLEVINENDKKICCEGEGIEMVYGVPFDM